MSTYDRRSLWARLLERALSAWYWPLRRLRRLWRKPVPHLVTLITYRRRVAADVSRIAWTIPEGASLMRMRLDFRSESGDLLKQATYFGRCGLCAFSDTRSGLLFRHQTSYIPFSWLLPLAPFGAAPEISPWYDLTLLGRALEGGPWTFEIEFHDDLRSVDEAEAIETGIPERPVYRWAEFPGDASVALVVQGIVTPPKSWPDSVYAKALGDERARP